MVIVSSCRLPAAVRGHSTILENVVIIGILCNEWIAWVCLMYAIFTLVVENNVCPVVLRITHEVSAQYRIDFKTLNNRICI